MTLVPLACGIDTLYWSSACGIDDERFAAFVAGRELSKTEPQTVEFAGYSLSVEPRGGGKYPVLLTCAEFSVQLTSSKVLPTVYVQLRAEFIHEVGPREAFDRSAAVAAAVVGRDLVRPLASRLDVYADIPGWVLTDRERRGLISKAKLHAVLRTGGDEYQTLTVGKYPQCLRLYRKDIEVREKRGFADVFWKGYAGPVTRIEVEAWSTKLRPAGIETVEDALTKYGNLWRQGTTAFCVLREPGEGSPEAWAIRPEWREIQAIAFSAFPTSETVPLVKAERNEKYVVRTLLGALASWAALRGVFDPVEALAQLREEYPRLVWRPGVTFAEEIVRRHIRLPQKVRERLP